jgi:hypothetical protein
MTKKSSKKSSLTLHGLLGALSFWGTASRALLFSVIAMVGFSFALSETPNTQAGDNQILLLIAALACFIVLDFGYVLIARVYLLQGRLDSLVLLVADLLLASLYVIPRIVVDSSITLPADPLMYAFFMPIIVLSGRMLLGMLFSGRR